MADASSCSSEAMCQPLCHLVMSLLRPVPQFPQESSQVVLSYLTGSSCSLMGLWGSTGVTAVGALEE